MASPGSQYVFAALGLAVNVVLTTDGTNLPAGVGGKFNIELVTNPPNGTNFNVSFGQGYQTAVLLPGGTGQTAQMLSGNYSLTDTGGNDAITMLSNGAQTIVGAHGDTLTGGSGNDLLNAIAGTQLVIAGTGATTIFGGVGDTIVGPTVSGTAVIDGSAGGQSISGGNGLSTIIGGAGDTISGTGGGGASTIFGAQNDTITAGGGADAINATAGKQLINGGAGSMSVFGGQGDTINASTGDSYIDGTAGGMLIAAGSRGTDTILGSSAAASGAPVDTITGGAAAVQIQGLGKGDIVNFAAQSGNAQINALAGNNLITLGSGFAAVYGGIGDTINFGSGPQLATGFSGGTRIVVGTGTNGDTIIGSVAPVFGAGGDTIIGGSASALIQGLGAGDFVNFAAESGSSTINGTGGLVSIGLGSGNATVFGGIGDAITFGSGQQYADGLNGSELIVVGAGGSDTIVGSAFRASGVGVDTLIGGGAAVLVQGLGQGDIVNFKAQTGSAAINATAGNNAVTLGAGAATVFGGVGGSIALGSGQQFAAALSGGETVAVGTAGGADTIVGSVARASGAGVDTIIGGAAAVVVSGVGQGDIINFLAQTGTAAINALAGGNVITLGAGNASIFGGANSTFNLGTGNQYVDASAAPGSLIDLGAAGTDNVVGSTVGGAANNTIHGGNANLNYNVGVGGDLIDLTGSTGQAVINAFGTDTGPIQDTVIAGNGGSSVFGGQGDRIAVGLGASGTDLFVHSTTINGASIAFGTNDSIAAVTYGSGAGQVTVNGGLGASTAQVTVNGFSETGGVANDSLFYQNEGPGTTASIVATSSQVTVGGAASTQFTLPDGTVMTLLGIAKADFGVSFFKA